MAANPHNVDICVTCVCDKPPTLPLREELPSLGIEVIYNAKGVGAEAADREAKKERERIQKHNAKKGKKKLSPPGKTSFFSKLPKSDIQKQDPPDGLAIPKALSYGSYQRTLDIRVKSDTQSISSSIETSPSMDEHIYVRKKKLAKRIKGLFAKKKNPNDPPNSIKFPNAQTPEDAALEEAFNAFMDDGGDDDVPEEPSKLESPVKNPSGKKEIFPDLLEGSKAKYIEAKPSDERTKKASDHSSSGLDSTTVSSLGNDSSHYKSGLIYDAEAFSKQAIDRLMQKKSTATNGNPPTKANKGLKGTGNIKVKLLSNGEDNKITEIYDLTEISESGSVIPHSDFPDLLANEDRNDTAYRSTLAPTSPYATDHNDRSQYSEESSVPVPAMQDAYGKVVLDVSDLYEQNGPGSPLMLSPVKQRGSSSFALSPASFAIPDYGQGKKKQSSFLPSFLSDPMRDDEFAQDGRDDIVVYRSEVDSDMSSGFRERNLSPVRLEVASPYRSYSTRADRSVMESIASTPSLSMKVKSFDDAVENYYNRATRSTRLITSPASKLVPAMGKSVSRESHDSLKSPKVSFSEDIEERRYFKKENDYEKAMAGVKSSLSAIVNEGRDLIEPLPSAVSREADAAFQAFEDELDVEENPRTPQQMLLEALSYGDPIPFDFEETIKQNPTIASQRLPDLDAFALHSACSRAFPTRFAKGQTCRVKDLVADLQLHRKLIEALVTANPETCRRIDTNGDLPVHIMARQLMEWEGQWYQKVYDKAKGQDEDQDSGAGITTLYQSMSECVNFLLQPIIEDTSLFLKSGSVGRILPLHIAAIFTVPYNTLKTLLEAYPNAGSIKCDLTDIKTFVPNHSTPLELHDRLSTDFPKWEIQRVNDDPDEAMSQAKLDMIYGTKNGIRRSDLMFAFSPNLLPYRKEAYRVRRMESMIQKEMKKQDKGNKFVLTRAAEYFWVWLCEFENEDHTSDHYAESVSRIIEPLPYHAVRYLASVLNGGRPVIDRANPICADAIIGRLDQISKTQIPVPVQKISTSWEATVKSSLLSQFDEDTSKKLRLYGQGFVGPLCRTIFNITEAAYPSSFVLLPYKLVKDADGRLGLESSQAAKAAMKFAEFLSDLTTPKSIVDTLDNKICQTLGENLVDKMNRASRESRSSRFTEFLKLYENNEHAYFYFIDDCTGVPIVDESNGIYPLIIADAAEMVKKVFPMMLAGMILMRGEKAISILVDVLLDHNIKLVLPHWIEAAKDLIGYTLTPHGNSRDPSLKALIPLQENLLKLVQYGATENEAIEKLKTGGLPSEWVVENSLIKMIVDMHDPRHYFCGLSQERAKTQILWTHASDVVNETLNEYDFESAKNLKDNLHEKKHGEGKITRHPNGKVFGKNSSISDFSSDDYDDSSEDEMKGMTITTTEMENTEAVESDISYHARDTKPRLRPQPPKEQPESSSTSSFESPINADSVVKLQVQLEEQEEKLHSLREKISDLDTAGDELEKREENLSHMIDEIVTQKCTLVTPSKDGMAKAKALLQRITELEDRVLCREVEVGQLKNDVTFLEMKASDRTESRTLDEVGDQSSSNHSGLPSPDETDHAQDEGNYASSDDSLLPPPDETNDIDDGDETDDLHDEDYQAPAVSRDEDAKSKDEDIKSVESGHLSVSNIDEVLGVPDNDESTVGNSTMYNSSIDGYSDGYSAAGIGRY
jgi:hypothetical protein